MKKLLIAVLILAAASFTTAQSFKVDREGEQTFSFKDKAGRNTITFFSTTPLEDITGTANAISGTVSFDVKDFANTLKGKLIVQVASMKTGIDLRDEHLRSANWLNEEEYPEIHFEIKEVKNVEQVEDNKLKAVVVEDVTLHGVTKPVNANVEVTYLEESEKTKQRAPGDLLGVRADFDINLSDFNVENQVVGEKVAEKIEVSVNIVGSNKF